MFGNSRAGVSEKEEEDIIGCSHTSIPQSVRIPNTSTSGYGTNNEHEVTKPTEDTSAYQPSGNDTASVQIQADLWIRNIVFSSNVYPDVDDEEDSPPQPVNTDVLIAHDSFLDPIAGAPRKNKHSELVIGNLGQSKPDSRSDSPIDTEWLDRMHQSVMVHPESRVVCSRFWSTDDSTNEAGKRREWVVPEFNGPPAACHPNGETLIQ
jgi:hypothetical protein